MADPAEDFSMEQAHPVPTPVVVPTPPTAPAIPGTDPNAVSAYLGKSPVERAGEWNPIASPAAPVQHGVPRADAPFESAPANDTVAPIPPNSGPPPGSGGGVAVRPQSGGFGGFAPILPQYYPPDYAEQVIEAHAKGREKLTNDFFTNDMSPDELDQKLVELDKMRDGELAKVQQFNNSFAGKQVGLDRHRMDAHGRQQDIKAQAHGMDAWAQQHRGMQMQRARKDYDASHEQFALRRERMMQNVGAEMDSYRAAAKDLANTRIDPDRYWKNKGTAGQIGAGIAMALGTAGAILTKRPNEVAALLQKKIEQDIDAQKTDLMSKKAGVAAQGNLVGMMRQRLGDVEMAEKAAKAHIFAQLRQRMELTANTAKSEKTRLAATALHAQFNDRVVGFEKELELQAIAKAKLLEQQRAMAAAGAAAARARAAAEAAKARSGILAELPLTPDMRKRLVHGAGIALTAKDAEQLKGQIAGSKEAQVLFDQLMTGDKYNSGDRGKMIAARSLLIAQLNQQLLKSALDQQNQEFVTKMTGDLVSVINTDGWTADAQEQAKFIKRYMNNQTANQVRQRLQYPGQMVSGNDDKGKYRSKFQVTPSVPGFAPVEAGQKVQ